MWRSSGDLLLSSKPSLERLTFIQPWDVHILWVILKCLISVCLGQNGSSLICDHCHTWLYFISAHNAVVQSNTLCWPQIWTLSLWLLNKNVFSFHHPPNGWEKWSAKLSFFFWPSAQMKKPWQDFCAIFHHLEWKDGRMIKSTFLFHFHVRRWHETPIQVWEAKLDEWNMLPVWESGVTKQLIKLNKLPNSRARISTAAGRSSLILYLNCQGWASHSRAAVRAIMAVGNLHCLWSCTWLTRCLLGWISNKVAKSG